MAGYFTHIYWDKEQGKVDASTHGCGCCSEFKENISAEEIQEHINCLEEDIQKAKDLLVIKQKLDVAKTEIAKTIQTMEEDFNEPML